MARRPELQAPADIYYNEAEARKYTVNTRIQDVQQRMTRRAVELLALTPGVSCHILDVGCGSGLSGKVLESEGHTWVGTDISVPMLRIARSFEDDSSDDEDTDEGGAPPVPPMSEVIHHDMGLGLPFRPGVFDGAVSISAVQWLCNIDKKGQVPQRRLKAFFQSLYNALRRGARAVLQFYPDSPQQMDMINNSAMKCGFSGGMVIDFPHSTRARKCYLVLIAGQGGGSYVPPTPLEGDESEEVSVESEGSSSEGEEGEETESGDDEQKVRTFPRKRPAASARKGKGRKKRTEQRPEAGTKEWVLMKKAQRRGFGLDTRPDTKYTMRRRKPKF